MAIAEGKAFAQIKGSYIKLKVKSPPASLKVGDHVVSKLKKVTKEKISSVFSEVVNKKDTQTQEEKNVMAIMTSVTQEASRELEQLRQLCKVDNKKADFDTSLVDQKNFLPQGDQLAQ